MSAAEKVHRGWTALDDTHAVHENRCEVAYSRYSVTYRDPDVTLSLGAEFDDDGVLLIHSAASAPRSILARIEEALAFLEVRFRLE